LSKIEKKVLKIKEEFLKVLKEDEEFRYVIAGYLNLTDIRTSLAKLAEAQAKTEERLTRLEEAVERLAEAQKRTEERVTKLEEAVAKLAEAQAKTEERLTRLEEAVERLAEAQKRTEERVTKLEEAVAKLAEAQAKTEERLTRLEEAVERLAEAQKRTEERVNELSNAMKMLSIQVERLSDVVGFSLEDVAKVVLPGWLLRHEKINIESLERKFLEVNGELIEVNLYGEGEKNGLKITVIGEAKSRIYEKDVKDFCKKISRIEKTLKPPVYKLMFGFLIHPTAEKEAEAYGIKLIASYMR